MIIDRYRCYLLAEFKKKNVTICEEWKSC